jgi:glyoxylase-like metal-dependent hydrolase (beta-lactamase superfamily II)
MRIHHLNCGTMRPVGGTLLDGRPGLLRRSEMVCHCLLVESEAGLVLVETGLGTPSVTRPEQWLGRDFQLLTAPSRSAEQTAVAQIERLGFDPSDVRHIVLTHLDLDHAGGLVDFPAATVHVYATELDSMRARRTRADKQRYRQAHFAHGPRFRSYQVDGEPWFGFESVRELEGLDGDVVIVPLAGHTRGHAGVAVRSGQGWLLNAGDAYFWHGELDPAGPSMPPGLRLFEALVQTESRARRENQERLRTLVAEHGDEVSVFCAHDPIEFHRLCEPVGGIPRTDG